jgi:hypothetical protein
MEETTTRSLTRRSVELRSRGTNMRRGHEGEYDPLTRPYAIPVQLNGSRSSHIAADMQAKSDIFYPSHQKLPHRRCLDLRWPITARPLLYATCHLCITQCFLSNSVNHTVMTLRNDSHEWSRYVAQPRLSEMVNCCLVSQVTALAIVFDSSWQL